MASELRYGGDRAFPPFESLDPQGRPTGFLIELLSLLGPKLGARTTVTLDEWHITEQRFRAGQLDLIAMVELDERRQWAQFSRSVAALQLAVFLPAAAIEPQGARDLAKLRLAALKSAPMPETLVSYLPFIEAPVFADADPVAVLQAVVDGKADAALMVKAYGMPALKTIGPALKMSTLALNLQSYAFAVQPGRLHLLNALNTAIEALEVDGSLEALRIKWLPTHQAPAMRQKLDFAATELRQRTVLGGLTAAVVCAGLAGLWAIKRRQLRFESTHRYKAEQRLAQTQSLLDSIFGEHPDAIVVIDPLARTITAANRSFHVWFPADVWSGRSLEQWSVMLPAEGIEAIDSLARSEGDELSFPIDLATPESRSRYVWLLARRLALEDGGAIVVVLRDFSATVARAPQLIQDLRVDLGRGIAPASGRGLLTQAALHTVKERTEVMKGLNQILDERLKGGRIEDARSISQSIQSALDRVSLVLHGLERYADIEMRPVQPMVNDVETIVRATFDALMKNNTGGPATLIAEDLGEVVADPLDLAHLWHSILENAFQYRKPDTELRIHVEVVEREGQRWFRVADNGMGFDMRSMPAQKWPMLADATGTHPMMGFGLPIVGLIVRRHHGKVLIDSGPGVGTSLEFTLALS